ncbi:HAD family hydrolase [Corynebacterium kutscheri]
MMNSHADENWQLSPEEFLAEWSATRGNLRRFFEKHALPPVNNMTQRSAGEAAAAQAIADLYGLEFSDFTTGLETVSGSFQAAINTSTTTPDPHITPDNGVAAFFDIDNTLIQGSSLIAFAYGLAKRRYFKISEIIPVAWKQIKFRVTGSENFSDIMEGRQQALAFIKGRSVKELTQLCEEIVDTNISEKLWPGTQQLAEEHIARGQQVWLVSATPVQLGQVLAQRLGFTGAIGTVPEQKDGYFTGRLVGDILHGPGKSYAVAALSSLERLDLSKCTAYSDSINDLPMLNMVGTAVAINPDKHLRRVAKQNNWPIRDFRSWRKAINNYGIPTLSAAIFFSIIKMLQRIRSQLSD